jgi:uncharacterized protein YeaO (DUF488 family)
MSDYLLVRHKVRDFSEWKRSYDAHQSMREAAGLTEQQLLHGSEDPNEVTVLFQAKDPTRAHAFVESADLRDTMRQAGVVDTPDIYFLSS